MQGDRNNLDNVFTITNKFLAQSLPRGLSEHRAILRVFIINIISKGCANLVSALTERIDVV